MPEDEVLSSLSVIYGFFLMFISMLIGGLDWIPGSLSDYGQQLTYGAVWAAVTGSMLLGFEIWKRLYSKGLFKTGHFAMFLLTIVLSFFFLRFVGDLVLQAEPQHADIRTWGLLLWFLAVFVGGYFTVEEPIRLWTRRRS